MEFFKILDVDYFGCFIKIMIFIGVFKCCVGGDIFDENFIWFFINEVGFFDEVENLYQVVEE